MNHALSHDGLIDKSLISDLIHAYCFHFDRAEPEALIDLFTTDALIDYGPDVPPMSGQAEFGPMIERGLAELFAATSHHISNIVIRFDGWDTATSVSYLYAWHRYRETNKTSELWGQYHHSFRRTGDGWKISRLVLKVAGNENFHRKNMHPIGRRV
jgi:ketosteroid isomerase-like protein